ncbi:hypothetical protein GALL_186910 [mine drainage metagenome]|uniref:Uncharacterized protein n=1 Tax=mine drainage metagenome TaxID=410659 RepID=A0A1J5RUC5_9ZZZZ
MNRRGHPLSLLACNIWLSDAAALARGQPLYPARTVPQYPTEFAVEIDRHVARALGLDRNAAVLATRLQQMEQVP